MKTIIKKSKLLEKIARKIYSFIPYEKRVLTKDFYDFLALLKENEKKSYEQMREYQFKKLKELVELAYNHTKFYKEKYDKVGFHPNDLKSLEDLNKIPTLTKDEVREYGKDMVDKRLNIDSLSKGVTSGTTGKALTIYQSSSTSAKEWASICYQWERVGYKAGDGRIELRGFIDGKEDYIFIPDQRVLRINIIKMSENNIEKILEKIRSLNYQFIHGYPAAIYKFAKIIQAKNIDYNPKAIMMASEVLYDWQMQVLDEVFDCNKIIHYGLAEKSTLGAWVNDRKYHFIPTYGITEYDEETKELIATGFINSAMPLIRYRLTDAIAGFVEKPLDSNKCLYPIIENIEGRDGDYTYDENSSLVAPAVVTFPFKQLKYIEAAKIIQNDINDFELIFEIIVDEKNEDLNKEVENLLKDFYKIYGQKAKFKITFTNKIPLGKSGKFRWIECRINKI